MSLFILLFTKLKQINKTQEIVNNLNNFHFLNISISSKFKKKLKQFFSYFPNIFNKFLLILKHTRELSTQLYFISMYSFPQQQKIFKDLLSNNSSNKQCADCNTIGPTWASLNFGVFLCSNCSGAHRALGPTITRVKSTKLDQWQKDWMECMQVGNKQLNFFWQSELGMAKKPKMGSSQHELLKYATEKYIKKKFVKNLGEQDPLSKYKKGTYVKDTIVQQNKAPVKKIVQSNSQSKKKSDARSNVAVQNEPKNLNLIEFQFPQSPKLQVQSLAPEGYRSNVTNNVCYGQNLCNPRQVKQKTEYNGPGQHINQDDEFSDFTEHGTSFTGTTTQNNVTYEQLIAKKSNDSADNHFHIPQSLHHTHSASSIPQSHYASPHFNVNMNGHTHHVGGHAVGYNNNTNFNSIYNQQVNNIQSNPYQSVGYIPAQTQIYNQHQNYNSVYTPPINQSNQVQNISLNANYNINQVNNNLSFHSMSKPQQNLNPQNMTLGGYHNQGIGSHSVQTTPSFEQTQPYYGQTFSQNKKQEFHWNDFSGLGGLTKPHFQNNSQSNHQASESETKSWVDDWK